MLYIPLLWDALEFFRDPDTYEILCIVNILSAIVLLFYFFKKPLRTGKFYKASRDRELLIPDKYAVCSFNLIPILVFMFSLEVFDCFWLAQPQSIVFVMIHLVHAYVGLRRSRHSNPWPIFPYLYTILYKSMCAILAARAFVDNESVCNVELYQYIEVCVIVALLFYQGWLDHSRTNLRFHGAKGYKIPTGMAYNFISCPSYLIEIVIWFIWGLMYSLDFGVFAVWIWLLPNVYGRAEVTHRWYLKVFRGSFPNKRTAIIPFLDVGMVLTAILGSMEYGW